jgi:stage V sporulation protein G
MDFEGTRSRNSRWVRRMGLEITEVRISLRDDDKLKAFASMTFNDQFVIRGLKIIEGTNGMFVAMPSRKRPDCTYQDIAHGSSTSTRRNGRGSRPGP